MKSGRIRDILPECGSNRFIEDDPKAVVILDRSHEAGPVLLGPLSAEELTEVDQRQGDSILSEEILGDDVDLASARRHSREAAERVFGIGSDC